MDKISIIVPIYNVSKYLNRCISSIINQTYKNLEIILIDDGSTDSSSNICDHYLKLDSRIKVIHKKNEGVSKTKNLGMSLSTSDFIAFIDGDDYVDETYIECLYNNLIETNSSVSIVGYKVINQKNNVIYDSVIDANLNSDIKVYEDIDIIKELLLQKRIKNFGCKLYRKDVLLNFEENVTYEDIVFSLKVMMRSKKVVYINKSLYNYDKRDDSITATITEKNLFDFYRAIINRYNIVNEKYKAISDYNTYALLKSTIAIESKDAISNKKYKNLSNSILKLINIINNYKFNINFDILTDDDIKCLNLMRKDVNLLYDYLKEKEMKKLNLK